MQRHGAFLNVPVLAHLIVRPGTDLYAMGWRTGRCAVVCGDLAYIDGAGRRHTAQAGEMSDGGTLPWLAAYWFDERWGRFLSAYLIHDHYCCAARALWMSGDAEGARCLRLDGDLLLPEMIDALDGSLFKRIIAFRAVRLAARAAGLA